MSDELKKGLGRLQTLRDEVRVKIHLASMNVKDQWKKLEPGIEEVEKEVGKAAHDISEKSKNALNDALKRLEKLRDTLHGEGKGPSGGEGSSGG